MSSQFQCGLVAQPTAINPDAKSVVVPPLSLAGDSDPLEKKCVHRLKHRRSRTALTASLNGEHNKHPHASGEFTSVAASSTLQRFAESIGCNLANGGGVVFSDVKQCDELVSEIRKEFDTWAQALPTYASILRQACTVVTEVMETNINETADSMHARQQEALASAIQALSVPYNEQISSLQQRADAATKEMESLRQRRVQREREERQFLSNLRDTIAKTKKRFEEQEMQERTGNDRIQALYARNREFRQIVAKRDDIEKNVGERLQTNEVLTKEKSALIDSIRELIDSIDPTVAAIQWKKIEAERRTHSLGNKKVTVQRQVDTLTDELAVRERELQSITRHNESLCRVREDWSSRLSAIEAEALRDYTPRPDWHQKGVDNAGDSGTPSESLKLSIPGSDVPPLSEFIEMKHRASSSHIIDAALKKLTFLMTSTRKAVDELLRLTVVIHPVIQCGTAHLQSDVQRMDAVEGDSITINDEQLSFTPIGLILPSGTNFADVASRLQVQGAIVAVDDEAVSFRNEKWSQAATERQAMALMTAISQITLSANVQASANTPLMLASELLAKWCSASVERDCASGFGANFLSSLRYYSQCSTICLAACQICYGELPVNFGDQVLQHIQAILDQIEPTQTPTGGSAATPLRGLLNAVGRLYTKETLFGPLQVYQAKFALACDGATLGSVIKLPAILDIVEQRRNSGLFARCVFGHFLAQHKILYQSVAQAVFDVAKSSPVFKMLMVSETAVKARLDTVRWEGESAMADGIRFSQSSAGSRRILQLGGRSALLETLFHGVPRHDAQMLRVYEEDVFAAIPAIGATKQGTAAIKRGDYVGVDAVLQRLATVNIKVSEKV